MLEIGLTRAGGTRVLMHVFFLLLLGLAFAAPGKAWAARDETPNCGGDGQNACWFSKAKKHGSVACRSGEFYDLLTNTCWSCGSGWNRSLFPIKGDKACHKPPRVERKKARWLRAGTACDPKRLEFFDLSTWACWTCGSGYGRTVFPIKSGNACEKTIGGTFKKATPKRARECGPGQFLDARNGGECWSCPAGYNRHITPVTADDACIPSATPSARNAAVAASRASALASSGSGCRLAIPASTRISKRTPARNCGPAKPPSSRAWRVSAAKPAM